MPENIDDKANSEFERDRIEDLSRFWLTTKDGKIIKPVEIWKGRPVYKYEDLVQFGPPYSEGAWE